MGWIQGLERIDGWRKGCLCRRCASPLLPRSNPTQPIPIPPPSTRQFEDKYWDALVSSARYNLSPQGRLLFEFTSNVVKFNSPFSQGSVLRIPLPQNVGNLGTAFADVSYMDGTMWIEKLRDNATGQVFYTIFEYVGPCEEEATGAAGAGAGAGGAGGAP